MNRQQLIRLFMDRTDLTVEEADLIVRTFFEAIEEGLKRDGRVELRGFGVFRIKSRSQAGFKNPKNNVYYGGCELKTVRFSQSRINWDLISAVTKKD